MRFQTRILFTYSLLIFFLVVVLGITFYGYTSRLFENNAVQTYELLSSRISLHLDNLIRPMDFVTTNLISDVGFKSALISLATLDRADPQNKPLLNDSARSIRSMLLTYSIEKNFYSVTVVTQKRDFYSSNFVDHAQVTYEERPLDSLPGYPAAEAAQGPVIVVPPHIDPWNSGRAVEVYGVARVMPGPEGDLGFLEVQNPVSELDSLFTVPDRGHVRILALQRDGSVFYESDPTTPALVAYYRTLASTPPAAPGFRDNPLDGNNELVISAQSSYTGITIFLILDRNIVLRPLAFVGWTTAGVGFLIILVSVIYNWIASAQLTKPLRMMRRKMELTELSNLPGQGTIDHQNDEVAALDQSFQRLTARLDDAIKRELQSRTLWLQARLDSLQAQVNPHFLYNILTVIAGKGLELGDEEIGEICDAIAAMLRYSTSTVDRSATLAEEIDHVRTYLFLMKKRFEDRLSFTIDVAPEILPAAIPKIVLQQIVENSVNHAFRDNQRTMTVTILGYRAGDGWTIELRDNGQGFDPSLLAQLRERIAAFDARTGSADDGSGLKIGGLGLLNTYIRLHLFYRGEFVFRMENLPEGGARVLIGSTLATGASEKGGVDVQSAARRG